MTTATFQEHNAANRDPRLKNCICGVYATGFEMMTLYLQFERQTQLKQLAPGYVETIGFDSAKRPIVVTVWFYAMYGKTFCFCEITSELADFKMFDEWWKNEIGIPLYQADQFETARESCDF